MFGKYSVLMTVYYKVRPTDFEESLNCILSQTVPPQEIVIVCDGPLTECLNEVLNEVIQSNPALFNIVRLEKNVGTAVATQIGIENCVNDLVMKMDSDDLCIVERASLLLSEFDKDSELSICGGYMGEFKDSVEGCKKIRKTPLTNEEILDFSKRRSPFNNITVMYKKSDVISAGGYSDLRRAQDYELYSRMLYKGFKGKNIPVVLSYARVDDENIERRVTKQNLVSFVKVRKSLKRQGIISFWDFLIPCCGQIVLMILPNYLRCVFYNKVLRDSK